jgi:hypothetical protein
MDLIIPLPILASHSSPTLHTSVTFTIMDPPPKDRLPRVATRLQLIHQTARGSAHKCASSCQFRPTSQGLVERVRDAPSLQKHAGGRARYDLALSHLH